MFSYAESITVLPDTPRVPDGVQVFTSLLCEIQPPTALVELRWLLPSGAYSTSSNDTYEYIVSLGTPPEFDHTSSSIALLTINFLSYRHAGEYFCEVRDTTTPSTGWTAAAVELQLPGNIKCTYCAWSPSLRY